MGLDMYARRVIGGAELECLADPLNPNFQGGVNELGERVFEYEFAYWRKHANLHGWMEKLYREKGGDAEVFNCIPFRLTLEDLDRLEADMNGNSLPHTTGFFFGASDEQDDRDTRRFIERAREAIAAGDAIFYDSWW